MAMVVLREKQVRSKWRDGSSTYLSNYNIRAYIVKSRVGKMAAPPQAEPVFTLIHCPLAGVQ
jgi:hypothetical protein